MRPTILGIVNITEDSFSDGGHYLSPGQAVAHGRRLAGGGASILDLGAAASNPIAKAVAPEQEIGRLAPVFAALKSDGLAISVDSFSLPVQRWALAQGADYLNDIHGFPDRELYPELADSPAKLIVMHAVQASGRATAVDVPPASIVDRVRRFFEARIAALSLAGIGRDRLVLDPGMGFFLGNDPRNSFTVLKELPRLKDLFGLPVLVSVSRKSFLRKLVGRGPAESGPATLAAELFAILHGADYIRTHDPAALSDALTVWSAATTGNRT